MRQRNAVSDARPAHSIQVIAVSGGKGGTGKTTVAVNLATALAAAGRSVLLLDGDLGLANVDVVLGLTPRGTLEQVLQGTRRLEEIVLRSSDGVSVIPAASGVARMANLPQQELAAIVQAFSSLPGSYDALLIDTAAGLGDSVLAFCQAAQHQLLVIRNEPTSLTDAYALIKTLSQERKVRRFRVLVNMARAGSEPQLLFKRLQRVTERFLDVVLDYAGEIPDDESVARAVRARRSVLAASPGAPAARAYRQLAAAVQDWPAPGEGASGIQFFIEGMPARPPARLQVVK